MPGAAGDAGRANRAGQRLGAEQAGDLVGRLRRAVLRQIDERDRARREMRDDRVLIAGVDETSNGSSAMAPMVESLRMFVMRCWSSQTA